MKKIHVRLDGIGGRAMELEQLKSVYVSDMEFEPDERRQLIMDDGVVELLITHSPYMVHAKLKLPLYGNIWVMAHNEGKGYTGDFVDFVSEAVRSYLYEAHDWANCFELSQEQLLDLTEVCCKALKEADPQAVSVVNVCLPFAEYVAGRYNCYGSLPEHLCSPLAYLKKVCEQEIPFDVVGIQLYFPARDMVGG